MLGVIACHFNPAGFQTPVRNWQLWRRQFPDNLPLVTIELSYSGDFQTDASIRLQGAAQHVLWQKEALLNIALQRLPPEVNQVAWIDADVICEDVTWLQQTAAALEQYPLVQMFRQITLTNPQLQPFQTWPGAAAAGSVDYGTCKPGYAWACHRDILDRCGFYPWFIIGAGDVGLINAARGEWRTAWLMRYHAALRQHWLLWGRDFYREIQGQVGYVDVPLIHLHHGSATHRRYATRELLLIEHKFAPERDVILREGLLEWSPTAPRALIDGVADFFRERKEDE